MSNDKLDQNQAELDKRIAVRDRLNNVSPSFCLAKWLQSTTVLHNGMTHSCHHPGQHKIRVEDIKRNPRGLHNTPVKLKARQDMLNGVQTPECGYCWNIENLSKDHLSDRTFKSSDNWALPSFDQVLASGLGENTLPSYLEVSFEHTCNFKCTYCSPEFSSSWQEEIERHGEYQLTDYKLHGLDFLRSVGRMPISRKEENPYIEAFWKWWPELRENLHTFRITGGEPLLSKHTWAINDDLKLHGHANLRYNINSNLGVPAKLIEKLIEDVRGLLADQKINCFTLHTSAETVGNHQEYIRNGLVWSDFLTNVHAWLSAFKDEPRCWLNFMPTHNVLSAPKFTEFLRLMKELRGTYGQRAENSKVHFMVNYLRHPNFLCLSQLTPTLKQKYIAEWRAEVAAGLYCEGAGRYYLEEAEQTERLCTFMLETPASPKLHADFWRYYREQDKRRGTDVRATFPELSEFFDTCELELARHA